MQSSETDSLKQTEFTSPAWPKLRVEVTVTKFEGVPTSFNIVNARPMQPGDWDLIQAAVAAANELPLPGEQPRLPTGLPSDLGPNTQVSLPSSALCARKIWAS